jgi:alkylation response protein AidB-like acyl-CoA dehydrogenase
MKCGGKIFASNGVTCDGAVVFATLDRSKGRGAIKAFVVMRDTPGFELVKKEHKMGLRVSDTTAYVLKDCRIPRENLQKLYRDARVGDIYEGTGEIQRLVIDRAILNYSSADLI